MDGGVIFDLLDYVFHHEEYGDLGKSGERYLYRGLKKVGVPKDRILRNVYIPVEDGKTTEIDVLVVSRKGLLVFEHKTYNGVIYGDGNQDRWVQYLGRKRFDFRSPVKQNEYHIKKLRNYANDEVPVYGFISHSMCGKWRVKNIPDGAHFLEKEGDFARIYNSLPNSYITEELIEKWKMKLEQLARPIDGTRERHVEGLEVKAKIALTSGILVITKIKTVNFGL